MCNSFRLFLIFLAGISSGCGDQPKVIDPRGEIALDAPVIDGIVNASDSAVFVQISRIKPFNEVIPLNPDRITDAIVSVSVNDGEQIPLVYESPYYRAKTNFPSGSIVRLTVKIAGDTYAAETLVPHLVQNINYKSLEGQSFRLSWDSDPSKKAFYEVQFAPETGLAYNVGDGGEPFFAAQSARVDLVGEYYRASQPVPGAENRILLHIHSLDANLYNYQKEGLRNGIYGSSPINTASPYSNFKGTIGVFGAYITTKFEVSEEPRFIR